MPTIIELVDNLYTTFDACKTSLAGHEGGKMRALKGIDLATFFAGLITIAVANNNLPFTVKTNHKIKVLKSGNKMSLDICVLNAAQKPIIHFEGKDYTDLSMFKRFVMDAMMLLTQFKNMKQVSLSMQNASDNETQQELINLIGNSYGLNGQFSSFVLLPIKRKAENNLYVLDFPKQELIDHATKLVAKLQEIIQ